MFEGGGVPPGAVQFGFETGLFLRVLRLFVGEPLFEGGGAGDGVGKGLVKRLDTGIRLIGFRMEVTKLRGRFNIARMWNVFVYL